MASRPDILLVNPGDRAQVYQSLGADLAAIESPVWVGLLASFARGKGCSVEILDANALGLTPRETAERVCELKPLLTAVTVYGHNPSASTQVMPSSGAICAAIKESEPALSVLLVGGHVSALPERTLREEKADFVCTGEGPFTLVELVAALKAGAAEFGKVRGLLFRDKTGDLVRTSPAPLIRDLDREMPGVAWDLLPMKRYRAHNWHCFGEIDRQPYAALYTTLGCPYHCSFCCIQSPFKEGEKEIGMRESSNSYRYWSPEFIVSQIDSLVREHGVRNFKFADEMFVLTPKHVLGICDRLIERGYDLNIWAYARVDTVRDGMAEKLRKAGFRWLGLGIESASERVRDDVEKGFDQEDIFNCVRALQAADICVGANYIFGLPEDDHESMRQTLELALEIGAEYANFYCAMAYPGSSLYAAAQQRGWPLPEKWSGYSQHSVDSLPLPTKHLAAGEVLAFRDKAFQVYFNDPRYLAMIHRRFGPATAEHIRGMAAHRLERQHARN